MLDPSNLPDDMRIAITESKTVAEVIEHLGLTVSHAVVREKAPRVRRVS
jgi:hypothetical protein